MGWLLLLSDTAFCAYFSDKNNFLAMFLPVRATKIEEIVLNFILDIGSEMWSLILDEFFSNYSYFIAEQLYKGQNFTQNTETQRMKIQDIQMFL